MLARRSRAQRNHSTGTDTPTSRPPSPPSPLLSKVAQPRPADRDDRQEQRDLLLVADPAMTWASRRPRRRGQKEKKNRRGGGGARAHARSRPAAWPRAARRRNLLLYSSRGATSPACARVFCKAPIRPRSYVPQVCTTPRLAASPCRFLCRKHATYDRPSRRPTWSLLPSYVDCAVPPGTRRRASRSHALIFW